MGGEDVLIELLKVDDRNIYDNACLILDLL